MIVVEKIGLWHSHRPGNWSERTRTHQCVSLLLSLANAAFVFHLRVRASSLLMILSKMLSPPTTDCVRDRLVRAMAIIIGVLFAFGVDLPSTPTQPWHNGFSCFSTWSIIIFNHCTVSAYCALHNGDQ